MRKTILMAAVAVFAFTKSNAQEGTFFDKVRVEAGFGFNLALSPDYVDRTDFSGLNTFQIGATYQINGLSGVRGTYADTTFKHKDFDNLGVNYNKLTAEATLNVLRAINSAKFS